MYYGDCGVQAHRRTCILVADLFPTRTAFVSHGFEARSGVVQRVMGALWPPSPAPDAQARGHPQRTGPRADAGLGGMHGTRFTRC